MWIVIRLGTFVDVIEKKNLENAKRYKWEWGSELDSFSTHKQAVEAAKDYVKKNEGFRLALTSTK